MSRNPVSLFIRLEASQDVESRISVPSILKSGTPDLQILSGLTGLMAHHSPE